MQNNNGRDREAAPEQQKFLPELELMIWENVKVTLPGGIESHLWAWDQTVRAAADLSFTEREYYTAITKQIIQLRIVLGPDDHLSLVAQRNWLDRPPMDFRTFVHFCANPNHRDYRNRTEIVIDLFTRNDLIDPAAELSDINWIRRRPATADSEADLITQADRKALGELRLTPVFAMWFKPSGFERDARIFKRSMSCWVQIIDLMPAYVVKAIVIAKHPDVVCLWRKFGDMPAEYLDEVKAALRSVGRMGKDVLGDVLLDGQEFPT